MERDSLDSDGQPIISAFSAARVNERAIDELIGICKGIISDKILSDGEIQFLIAWLTANKPCCEHWPANVLSTRIAEMLADNVIDEQEKRELFNALSHITGTTVLPNLGTSLPIDNPEPSVIFPEHSFCLTGQFIYGSRNKCESEIVHRSGILSKNVTLKIDYLVIGLIGSRDWMHSTFGRKIEKAIDFRNKGAALKIVSETHWVKFL